MIRFSFVTPSNLRLIRDVAQHRSVSKAARLNGISQSAASQQIHELERDLATSLFDRSTRPLTVTPAGKLYVEYCRDVLRRRDEFQTSLELLKKRVDGTVRLAAIYSVALSEMAEIETRFAARFPEAELHVSYLRPERVYESVASDEADLGLVSYAESSREVVALPWREEEMVVAIPPTHRLAGRQFLTAADLENEAFVGFDDDLPIQDHIARYFREHRVTVETVLHFDNLQMIKEAVAHDAGFSIMPRRVMTKDIEQGRLLALALHPAELYRPVSIIHRRRKSFNQAASGLLGLLQEETSNVAA
jgi:LysR family transcriptional regulator, transcriptional activator of the cysJI operon